MAVRRFAKLEHLILNQKPPQFRFSPRKHNAYVAEGKCEKIN
jgi:hypothetical protein